MDGTACAPTLTTKPTPQTPRLEAQGWAAMHFGNADLGDARRKPTLRTIAMIRFHFIGWAEADELEGHIAKLKPVEA